MSYERRIFGADVRRRYNRLVSLAAFLAATLPFALGLAVVHLIYPDGQGPVPLGIAIAALVVAPLSTWLAHNRLALAGNRGLRQALAEKLERRGEALPEGVKPVFVGFSPGEKQRLWDGDTDRDIGFLAAWGDALVYHGDDFDWYLPRDRIDIIEPMQPVAGTSRIRIRWHAPRESNRSFTLVSREARDLREARAATHALLQQLYAWVSRPPQSDDAAPKLGMPPTDVSGGRPLDDAPGGTCAVMLATMAATTVAAWQVGAPFVADEKYAHAILAAGCIFAIGFAVVNFAMRLLQWAEDEDAADRST
ncbi:MAG: hypothetical protein ACOX9R_10535 [Armatimonadota bacterium]|jgi:hypothetical protein